MTSEPDDPHSLLPLYVNGRLSEPQRKEFEEALSRDPALSREAGEYRAIREAYRFLAGEMPAPAPDLYLRIQSRIRRESGKAPARAAVNRLSSLVNFLRGIFSTPRLAWAVVGVQLAVILALLVIVPRGGKYETLSTGSGSAESGTRLNIIFKADSREKEIRELLGRVGATIVGGPSAEGLYTIAVRDRQDPESALQQLKSSAAVRFAEKAY